jgi:hypothetical protein
MRMENHTVATDSRGTQQLVRTEAVLPPSLGLAVSRELVAFSYFFTSYSWSPFWRPVMEVTPLPHDQPSTAYTGSLAVATGCLAADYRDKTLQIEGLELYQKAIVTFRGQLNNGSDKKTVIAALSTTAIVLEMYKVRGPPLAGIYNPG